MNPNLKWKVVFIVLVVLGCIYGLVGLPTFPTSVAQLKDNFSHQIKLGLDLQGGTHLVLQVQTQEAVAQETDQMVERVTTWLRGKNIRYDEVRRVDDTHILVRGVDPARLPEFRDYVNAQFANFWDMSPAAGDPSGYTLTLRGAAIAQIQETTMTQTLETIERRINALGLTEPTIQPRGGQNSNEILVQLPGEGDPSRAKQVIQAGGQLELKLVEDPVVYTSEAEALSKHGGLLPAGTELVPGRPETRTATGAPPDGEGWYNPDPRGRGHGPRPSQRHGKPQLQQPWPMGRGLYAFRRCRPSFWPFHPAESWPADGYRAGSSRLFRSDHQWTDR